MPRCDHHSLGARVRLAVAGVALVAGSAAAPAQAPERRDGAWRIVGDPVAGWHFFGPVRASVSGALGVGTGDLSIPAPGSRFVLAIAEPGLRGGRLSLAYVQWGGFNGGLVARATALRFWGGTPHRTFYGAELQYVVSVLPLGVRVGAFRPAPGMAERPRGVLWLADLSVMY